MFLKKGREDREEDERAAGQEHQGLVVEMTIRYQVYRLLLTLSAIAALAIAGGASIKGW